MKNRPFLWVTLFVVVFVSLGWTTRVLTEQISARETETMRPERAKRGGHGHRGRFPASGPFLSNVEECADELDLSEAQRQSLQNLVAETTERVQEKEQAIRELIHQTKSQVSELLTQEQRDKLKAMNKKRWEDYSQRKVQRSMDWLSQELSLDDAKLAQARVIFEEYQQARAQVFERLEQSSEPPSRGAMREQFQAAAQERDQRLAEVLTAEQMERYQNSGLDRRRGGWGKHKERGRRRGGPRM